MSERAQPAGGGVPARQSAEYVYRRVRAAILAGALLAGHVSRIAFEVAELIEPGRRLTTLRRVLADAGAAAPARAGGRSPEQAR